MTKMTPDSLYVCIWPNSPTRREQLPHGRSPIELPPGHSEARNVGLPRFRTCTVILLAWFSFLFVSNGASAQVSSDVWPTAQWQTSTPEQQGMDSNEIAKLIDFGSFQGIDSILIVRHGRIVTEVNYAPFKPEVRHALYSATKSVTGSLIAAALNDGLLDSVNHRALDFFKEKTIKNADNRKNNITIKNLLDMTSGLHWIEPYTGNIDILSNMSNSDNWVQFILDSPMESSPGDSFNYNSGSAHLLSAIITKLSGESALEYAQQKLFHPLGISDVVWIHDPQNITLGYSGLYLQPRDMAKIGYLYLRHGVWDGKRILPPGWIDEISHASIDTNDGLATDFHYANLFWTIPADEEFMASGRHGQRIIVLPTLDIVAVITGTEESYADSLIGYIKRSVRSNAPLRENPIGDNLLASRVQDVATEKASPVGPISDTAKMISNKVYHLIDNPLRLNSISLNLTDPTPSFQYEYSTGLPGATTIERFGCPVGLNGTYMLGAPSAEGVISAAKGTWVDEKTFVLKFQGLGLDDLRTWLLKFDGKNMDVFDVSREEVGVVLHAEGYE